MPKYYVMTRSGPIFQLRIPASLARRLQFKTLSFSMIPARQLKLRVQAQELASRARRGFELVKGLKDEELAQMSLQDLQKIVLPDLDLSANIMALTDHHDGEIRHAAQEKTLQTVTAIKEILSRNTIRQTPDQKSLTQCFIMAGQMKSRVDTRKGYVIDRDIDQLIIKAAETALNVAELRYAIWGLAPWRPHISADTHPTPEMPLTELRRQILSLPAKFDSILYQIEANVIQIDLPHYVEYFKCIAEIIKRDHRMLFFLAGANNVYPQERSGSAVLSMDISRAANVIDYSRLDQSLESSSVKISSKPKNEGVQEIVGQNKSRNPVFSDAINARIAEYRGTNINCPNATNLEIRRDMFVAAMGDIEIRQITRLVMREFMSKISYLPARVARTGEWRRGNLIEILVENGLETEGRGADQKGIIKEPTIGEKTLVEKTVRPLLSAINTFRSDNKMGDRIVDVFKSRPIHTPRSKSRKSVSPDFVSGVLSAGVKDGRLLQAMLPLLLITTGRRLGQICTMHGSDISFEHGQWLCQIPHQRFSSGKLQTSKDKTEDAQEAFVLHQKLEEIGFIAFAKSCGNRPVFASLFLSQIENRENTAQKRLDRLIRSVGVIGVAHQLRHTFIKIVDQIDTITEKFSTLQTGHAARTVRDGYAREWDSSTAAKIATIDFSNYFQWSIFKNFDFEKAQRKCVGKTQRQLNTSEQ